ncbi:MAG: hypothetical protein QM296_03870 [Bacillota bacterium]|nr:hypothetical protein [Bacillota bacterium]
MIEAIAVDAVPGSGAQAVCPCVPGIHNIEEDEDHIEPERSVLQVFLSADDTGIRQLLYFGQFLRLCSAEHIAIMLCYKLCSAGLDKPR